MTAGVAARPVSTGPWAPLADRVHRALWPAQLGSSVGTRYVSNAPRSDG